MAGVEAVGKDGFLRLVVAPTAVSGGRDYTLERAGSLLFLLLLLGKDGRGCL